MNKLLGMNVMTSKSISPSDIYLIRLFRPEVSFENDELHLTVSSRVEAVIKNVVLPNAEEEK